MPVADPISGRLFVWLTSCFLFISIAVGGGCLVAYLLLPQSPASSWLPIIGVTLVCLPWLFWLLTCVYRVISRAFGFRVVLGSGGGGGGAGGRTRLNTAGSVEPNVPGSNHGDAQAGAPGGGGMVMTEQQAAAKKNANNNMGGSSSSRSSNDISIVSHESEMPLTSAMAS